MVIRTTTTNNPMNISQKIAQVKWIEGAWRQGSGYGIVTKPNMLKTELTHTVVVYKDGKLEHGTKLEKPILLPLPSYTILLRNPKFGGYFDIRPTDKPNMLTPVVKFFPAYRNRHGDYQTSWDSFKPVCIGTYENTYWEAEDWLERAGVAAEFLQLAIPDIPSATDDRTKDRSLYAYGMGIAPPEIVQQATEEKEKELLNKEIRIRREAQQIQELYDALTSS